MTHYHCPNNCEHPQPQKDDIIIGGKLHQRMICLCCLYNGRGEVEMFLCTPETCN